MQTIFSTLFFFIALLCNKKQNHNNEDDQLKGIQIISLFPVLNYDTAANKLMLMRYDTLQTRVFVYKEKMLIQSDIPVRDIKMHNGKILSINEKKKYYSFIYTASSRTCAYVTDDDTTKVQFLPKDSVLKNEWIFSIDRSNIFKENELISISKIKNTDHQIEEKYLLKNLKDTTMKGSLLIVFSEKKFDDLGFSFSKEIERQKRMKLIKLTFVNFERVIPESNTYIDTVEIPEEIKEVKSFDKRYILKLFSLCPTQ
jgi:hypothetical protein